MKGEGIEGEVKWKEIGSEETGQGNEEKGGKESREGNRGQKCAKNYNK